ncbi:zinc finger BED domain-containing protein RICESLEEPER 2-like [Phthorimaea operculella]|nr:zinc finger BED domain-containing protein RICESLEEPER 2-like [Phthorimaea operculella]
MGRPKNQIIWAHYREGDNKSAICKHCEKKYKVATLQKMLRHLLKCLVCPESVKEQLRRSSTHNVSQSGVAGGSSMMPSGQNKENVIPELESMSSIGRTSTPTSINNISDRDKQNLHSELAKAIFVSGTPLSIVEHPLWLSFFGQLQPLYNLPTRKTLSTTLLDKTYNEMQRELKSEILAQTYLHLQLDGWSNCRNEGIINVIISKPEPVFVKSIATEENRHTGEYISEEILKIMSEYDANKFATLVGDNAANIQRAFRLVREQHQHVTSINCSAHTLHLLCKYIMRLPGLHNIKDIALHVIKAIKKSQVLTSLLAKIVKDKGAGETLKLPCDTRWGSYCKSFKSVQHSKSALQALAVHERASLLPAEEKSALLDENFWTMIGQCILILEPITDAIFKLESNQQNIHKVFITLKNMKSMLLFCLPEITIIDDATKENILTNVDERIDKCLKPIHLAAYMLDPAAQGVELDENQELDAMEYISETGQNIGLNVMPNLASYRARDSYWSRIFLWENIQGVSAANWWKGFCASTSLSKVAVRILSAPCTSAATERSFSAHSFIHNKIRNRLTTDRAAKITYISHNWALKNKGDMIEEDISHDCGFFWLPERQQESAPNYHDESSPLRTFSPEPSTSAVAPVADVEFYDCDNLTDSSDE